MTPRPVFIRASILVQNFAPLKTPLKAPLKILVIVLLRKFSKEISKEHSKEQKFCTRIGALVFLPSRAVAVVVVRIDGVVCDGVDKVDHPVAEDGV